MRAVYQGAVLAESDDTVVVEGNHYFPADSVRWDLFEPSATHTTCPWKGEASYYSAKVGDKVGTDVAWTYPDPKPAASNITGHVALERRQGRAVLTRAPAGSPLSVACLQQFEPDLAQRRVGRHHVPELLEGDATHDGDGGRVHEFGDIGTDERGANQHVLVSYRSPTWPCLGTRPAAMTCRRTRPCRIRPTSTSRPACLARFLLTPTDATCGSVKVT